MSYKTFLDKVLPEFTYEEALAFPSSGVYTGPCMDKLYDLCMEYAHMTDYDLTEVVSCRSAKNGTHLEIHSRDHTTAYS